MHAVAVCHSSRLLESSIRLWNEQAVHFCSPNPMGVRSWRVLQEQRSIAFEE
jgi:hypothetical protein